MSRSARLPLHLCLWPHPESMHPRWDWRHFGLSRQGTQGISASACHQWPTHLGPRPPPSLPPPRPRYADIIIHYLRGVATSLLARTIALETVQMTVEGGATAGEGALARGPAGLDDVSGLHAAETALTLPLHRGNQHEQGDGGGNDGSGVGVGGDVEGGEKTGSLCRVVGHRNHSFPVHCAKVRGRGGEGALEGGGGQCRIPCSQLSFSARLHYRHYPHFRTCLDVTAETNNCLHIFRTFPV